MIEISTKTRAFEESARAWLIDCYPDSDDEINELSYIELVNSINYYYDGGLKQFIMDDE